MVMGMSTPTSGPDDTESPHTTSKPSDQVLKDAGAIALAAATGATRGGASGAAIGAAKGILKSKTGRKVILIVVAVIAVVVLFVGMMASALIGAMGAAVVGANDEKEFGVVESIIPDAAQREILISASARYQAPLVVLAAIQSVQSKGNLAEGTFGIDLARAGSEINAERANDYGKSAAFIARELNEVMRDTVTHLPDTAIGVGLTYKQFEDGTEQRVPSTDPIDVEEQAISKAAWITALKMLPLTNIEVNAEAIFAAATTVTTGQTCPADPHVPSGATPEVPAVASLNASQSGYATQIVRATIDKKLPRQAAVIAIMTALQESTLRMWWNPKVPGSQALSPEPAAQGTDGYSVGLFQQQVHGAAFSWGTVEQAMDPIYSTGMFLDRLVTVVGWQTMGNGKAAQTVQVSAHPTYYDKWEDQAETIVTAVTPTGTVWGEAGGEAAEGGHQHGEETSPGESVDCGASGNTGGGQAGSIEGWVWPLEAGTPAPYGWRFHPIRHVWAIHYGTDIPQPAGTPIFAAADGVVIEARVYGSYGNWVLIQHANGMYSGYAHILDQGTLVTAGQTVTAGQQIAKVGSTGGSTGNHLHFEVRTGPLGTDAIDAEAFFQGRIVTANGTPRPS